MVARSLLSALLSLLVMVLLPASAHAKPWEIRYEPASPVAGEPVQFHADRENPGQGGGSSLVWDFGDGGTGTGQRPAAHVYAAAGQYTVTVSSPAGDGILVPADSVVIDVDPKPDPPNRRPSAAFTFAPVSPVVGDAVRFTGGSDSDGTVASRLWDFGDGTTSSGVSPTHSYAAAGRYPVGLTVTDDDGAFASSSQTVTVAPKAQAPPPEDGGTAVDGGSGTGDLADGGSPTQQPAATPLPLMRPFPVVRIAGVVLRRAALITILSVRTPRGASVRVRCRGTSCPVSSVARTAAVRTLRFRRFERRLAAGTTLEIFVRQRGRIGKYTRFAIRAGKAPARVDRCLVPGAARPVPCS